MTTETMSHRGRVFRAIASTLIVLLLTSATVVAQEPETTTPGAATMIPRAWARAAAPAPRAGWTINDVIAGGPGFIAVGGGTRARPGSRPEALVWVSDDGRTWQAAPLFGTATEGIMRGITATADGFVAVGNAPEGAAVWRSPEGIAWERVPHLPVFDQATMFDVASGPAGLVAVGCQAVTECASGVSWRSTDGLTWELLEGAPAVFVAIEAGAEGYLASGQLRSDSSPLVASSADGATWQGGQGMPAGPASLPALGAFQALALAGGSRAEGSAGRSVPVLMRSEDGHSWQALRRPRQANAELTDIAASAELVVLSGSRTQRRDGEATSLPFTLWRRDLGTFQPIRFPARSLRAGGSVNATAFSEDGSLIVAVGATDRPAPAVWFSRVTEARQPAAEEPAAQPSTAPGASEAPA
jgi:hypothetical protein